MMKLVEQEKLETKKMLSVEAELQKRADRADQSVLFFLAGAIFAREKLLIFGKSTQKTANFWC